MVFIEDMDVPLVGWGIPRTTGRIYAYLLLQREPATSDDIAAVLSVAKSGASRRCAFAHSGLARVAGLEPGSRRVHYEALCTTSSRSSAWRDGGR